MTCTLKFMNQGKVFFMLWAGVDLPHGRAGTASKGKRPPLGRPCVVWGRRWENAAHPCASPLGSSPRDVRRCSRRCSSNPERGFSSAPPTTQKGRPCGRPFRFGWWKRRQSHCLMNQWLKMRNADYAPRDTPKSIRLTNCRKLNQFYRSSGARHDFISLCHASIASSSIASIASALVSSSRSKS